MDGLLTLYLVAGLAFQGITLALAADYELVREGRTEPGPMWIIALTGSLVGMFWIIPAFTILKYKIDKYAEGK